MRVRYLIVFILCGILLDCNLTNALYMFNLSFINRNIERCMMYKAGVFVQRKGAVVK